MDITDFIRGRLEDMPREEAFKSKTEAKEALAKFTEYTPEFRDGDYLERNEYGKHNVKSPQDNQVAIFHKRMEVPKFENGDLRDIIILVALSKDVFGFYETSSKFYKKVEEKKNVFGFKRVK